MAKRMNLEDTWKLCLSMWRWIAKEWKSGNKQSTAILKKQWIEKHGYISEVGNWTPSFAADCFFCDYAWKYSNDESFPDYCRLCPAKKIDKGFQCQSSDYNYDNKPIAFYNKLRSLNRKRLKNKKGA